MSNFRRLLATFWDIVANKLCVDNPIGHIDCYTVLETKRLLLRLIQKQHGSRHIKSKTCSTPYMYTLFATSTEHIVRYASICAHLHTMRAYAMRAHALRMNTFASHRMRTHFSCVMRAFAYVIWVSSSSVMRAYARIRMWCEHFRIACARIRIACARIACECERLRGTCLVLFLHSKYWTHRWRIYINISHEISLIVRKSRLMTSYDGTSTK